MPLVKAKQRKPTMEDVWATLDRIAAMQEAYKKEMEETQRRNEEERKQRQQEYEKRLEEQEKQRLEYEKQHLEEQEKQRLEQLAERLEYEKRQEEQQKKWQKEREKRLAEFERQQSRWGNTLGEIVECLLTPALVEKFKELGFTIERMARDIELYKHGSAFAELDAFLENGDSTIAVEVKSNLKNEHVDKHIERLEKLRDYFNAKGDTRKLYGAVASTVVHESVKNYTLKKGLYVIEPTGENIKINAPHESTIQFW